MEHGDLRTWREMYAEFMRTLTADPSAAALLGLAERTTRCPLAVTDCHGRVVLTSPGYTGGSVIEPPALLDVADAKHWEDGRAVATPAAAPGDRFVWLIDGADPVDPRHRSCLFLVAEFIQLLSTFDLADRDPQRHLRWSLVERLLNGADPARTERDARELGITVTIAHVVVIGSAIDLSWRPVTCGIAAVLAPVLDYEGPHREEFTETLRRWLDWPDSLDALADHLHIHRSTLTYRLRRLRALLGDSLKDSERRFEMALALRLLERRRVLA